MVPVLNHFDSIYPWLSQDDGTGQRVGKEDRYGHGARWYRLEAWLLHGAQMNVEFNCLVFRG